MVQIFVIDQTIIIIQQQRKNIEIWNKSSILSTTKKKGKQYPELRLISSLVHSCHISELKGKIALMASLACLSFSISPCFLTAFMYYTATTKHCITNTHTHKKKKKTTPTANCFWKWETIYHHSNRSTQSFTEHLKCVC